MTQMSLKMLRFSDVCELFSISRSTVYEWVTEGRRGYVDEFPKPIKIGGSLFWRAAEVEHFISQQQGGGCNE